LFFPQRLIAALPWKLNARLKDTTSTLRSICRQLVQDKKQSIANEKDRDVDILSILIRSNNFADDMLVDQLLTFLAAG
jgi:cytochrome P450